MGKIHVFSMVKLTYFDWAIFWIATCSSHYQGVYSDRESDGTEWLQSTWCLSSHVLRHNLGSYTWQMTGIVENLGKSISAMGSYTSYIVLWPYLGRKWGFQQKKLQRQWPKRRVNHTLIPPTVLQRKLWESHQGGKWNSSVFPLETGPQCQKVHRFICYMVGKL